MNSMNHLNRLIVYLNIKINTVNVHDENMKNPEMKVKVWGSDWTKQPACVVLTCRLFCRSSVQQESVFSEEPDTPLRRSVSKARHMTGSGSALARLSLDLWVTSHSSREPSSYPASSSGPGPESGWGGGGGGRQRGA